MSGVTGTLFWVGGGEWGIILGVQRLLVHYFK